MAVVVALLSMVQVARSAPPGEVIPLPAVDCVTDPELVSRAREGDAWATEAIYRRYVRLVASTARRLLRCDFDVEDVVQETFLIAFEQLDRLADPAALRGWLARITISRVHRRFRWSRFTRLWSSAELEASLHDQAAAGATPEQRAELALIDRALEGMALKLRAPWVMRHVIGYQLDDIVIACDCSLATVKRRIQEAETIVAAHLGGTR